ncbi:MAG: S41 family peptidase, partial [Selenomonadaceae bacterium]
PEYVEDYEYLWDLLENEYPMLNAAERITDKKAEDVKQQYYYFISLAKTPQDFFDIVVRPCLAMFRETGHLSVVDDRLYTLYYQTSRPESGACNTEAAHNYSQITMPSATLFYKDDIRKIVFQDRTKPSQAVIANRRDNLSFHDYPEYSAAYVKINSMNTYFDSNNIEYDNLREFFTRLETEHIQNCIIDIRGNVGGDTNYWSNAIVRPNLSQPVTLKNYELIKGDACKAYTTGFWDVEAHPIAELPKDRLPRVSDGDVSETKSFIVRSVSYRPQARQPLFSGKYWLLVDGSNYSAAEAFAAFCKDTGFATLVGETTGGDGIGQSPIVFCLPHSGICVRFSASNGLNPDGTCNEEYGTTPDYPITESEDALQKCLSLISKT